MTCPDYSVKKGKPYCSLTDATPSDEQTRDECMGRYTKCRSGLLQKLSESSRKQLAAAIPRIEFEFFDPYSCETDSIF